MEVGNRVKFVGLFPKVYETVGTIVNQEGPMVRVLWDGDPRQVPHPLHKSQVEIIP